MTRTEFKRMVAKKLCSGCGMRRLMVGPFYDLKLVTCLSCGRKVRMKLKRKVQK